MAKKSERKRLTDRLDELCREIVRIVYSDTCQVCDKKCYGSNSHPCHIVPKGSGASWRRFDLMNIFLGCMHCHQRWHHSPIEAMKFLSEKFPAREGYLEKYIGGKPAKISTPEMRVLNEEYKLKFTQLKGEM